MKNPPRNPSNQGQLVVVVPLAAALAIGGLLLWGYMQSQQLAERSHRSTMSIEEVTNGTLKSTQNMLLYKTYATSNANCTTLNTLFSSYRNLASPNPTTTTITATNTACGSVNSIISCVMDTTQLCPTPSPSMWGPIQGVSLTATRLNPDLNSLSVGVAIQVSMTGNPVPGTYINGAAKVITKNDYFTIRIPSLFSYGLVLRDWSKNRTMPYNTALSITSANPQINVASGAYLEITGNVYSATAESSTSGYSQNLSDVMPLPTGPTPTSSFILIDGKFDTRADSVQYGTSTVPLYSDAIAALIKGGIFTGVFSLRAVQELPIEDPGPASAATTAPYGDAWDQVLDGNYLPDLSYLSVIPTSNPAGDYVTPWAAWPAWSPNPFPTPSFMASLLPFSTAQAYPGTSYTAWPAISASITIPNTTWSPWAMPLYNTCASSSQHSIAITPATYLPAPFVFQRLHQDLKVDFTIDGDNPNALCGLIAVDQLTVNLPSTGNYFIVGNVIATQLNITGGAGGAKLYIVNPFDNLTSTASSALPVTPGPTLSSVLSQLERLQLGVGHNFFVPIYQSISALSSIAIETQNGFRPHGPIIGPVVSPSPSAGLPSSTCPFFIGASPAPSPSYRPDIKAGYLCQCPSTWQTYGPTPADEYFCETQTYPITGIDVEYFLF